MSKKCDWCGKYYDEKSFYNYYRDDYNGRYRCYEFCSTACKFYFKKNTNLTEVDNNGFTKKELSMELKRRDQEIKDNYGSWENYELLQKQVQEKKNLIILRNKFFLYLFCPFILIILYKDDIISFLTLFILGFFWVLVSSMYWENH